MAVTGHPPGRHHRNGIPEVVFSDVPAELDSATVGDFEVAIGRVIARYRYSPPARLVVDLSGVSFICSSGVQALVNARREAEKVGIVLWVRDPSPIATKVLDILDLTDRLVEPS